MGSIPGSGDPLEKENPLQYSYLGYPINRRAWWATVHGVTKELDMTLRLNNSNSLLTTSFILSLQPYRTPFSCPIVNCFFSSHPDFLPAVLSVCNTSTYLFSWLTPIYSSDLSVSLTSSINPSFPDLQNWVWIPVPSLSSIYFTNRHILGT